MPRVRLLCGLGLFSLFVVVAPSLLAQQEQMNALAGSLARNVQKFDKNAFEKKLVVVDFPLRPGEINSLGAYLADQLSEAMRRQKPEFGVLDREQLHGYLQMGLLSQRDLQDEELALWVSQKIGANFVVFGSVTRSSKGITLHVRVVRSSDGLEITKAKADIPLDSNLQDLLAKPLPLPDYVVSAEPAPERLAVLCGNAERGGETNDLFASAGVSMPRCAHCPDPPYTEEVRKNRVQGSVTMHVVIGTDGRPISIRIVKGAPNGLNHLATEAVRKWWFEPATKDGKPVSVCTPVEITFRLF